MCARTRLVASALVVLLIGLAVACSTDSPTDPGGAGTAVPTTEPVGAPTSGPSPAPAPDAAAPPTPTFEALSDAFRYGDDPDLDGLWDACAAGSGKACDDLYYAAPLDSEYEEFGYTCGDRPNVIICTEIDDPTAVP